jgi:ribosomal protein RSM22 (predicted rRNA methylase)
MATMITLKELEKTFIHNFKGERELLKALEEIKVGFTTDRSLISNYVKDKKLVSAYLAVYASTNMAKYQELLARLPDTLVKQIGESEFIDFGAGPATFSFAHLRHFGTGEVVAIDKSKIMLEQASKLLSSEFGPSEFKVTQVIPPTTKSRVLFFGHAINEMGEKFAYQKIKEADADIVIWIEPGTKEFFEVAKKLRTRMLATGYNVQYPCVGAGECPMAVDDWCHQYVKVAHDKSIERLCQLAKLDRRTLPMIAHVYVKGEVEKADATICRTFPRSKHMSQFELCTNENKFIHFEAGYRSLNKKEQKEVEKLLHGEQVNFDIEKSLKVDSFRGRLSSKR